MNENAKLEIQAVLTLLRNTLISNGASIAVTDKGKVLVFDTEKYMKTGKMNGISFELDGLVK